MITNPGIALLYQAQQAPVKDGILKPMKPNGYADSGADIAFTLKIAGFNMITPSGNPDMMLDLDWVFPDNEEGIQLALHAGANCLWLNTVLYEGHPISKFPGISVVGQLPSAVDLYDDKWYTNNLLREHQLPIPEAELIIYEDFITKAPHLQPPLVAKPIRGRGSEGVTLVKQDEDYKKVLGEMFAQDRFGTAIYIEQYLSGDEITITVMPPGEYTINGLQQQKHSPWCLPGVLRFNHQDGIAPYNGTVAVVHNSRVLSDEEEADAQIQALYRQCETAAVLVGLKAPIRIDCRADENGDYFLFDLNMKPNMTGPSRPHRVDQNSLVAMAAEKIGWSFTDLLTNMLAQAWML